MLLTVQSLLKVAIQGAAVPSTEEGLLSLRVAEPLDLGRDGDGGEGGDREGGTDFSHFSPETHLIRASVLSGETRNCTGAHTIAFSS